MLQLEQVQFGVRIRVEVTLYLMCLIIKNVFIVQVCQDGLWMTGMIASLIKV